MSANPRWPDHDDEACPECCPDCLAALATGGAGCPKHCACRKPKTIGHLCQSPKGRGTDHPGIGRCKHHLGTTQNHRDAANRDKAATAVAVFGLPVDVDPQDALAAEVHRTAGHVAWLGAKIAGFQADAELVDTGRSAPSAFVALYQAERAHLVRVTKAALDAGVAERQVRFAEAQGRQVAEVVSGIIAGMFAELVAAGIDDALLARIRRERIPGVIRANLALLAGDVPTAAGEAS